MELRHLRYFVCVAEELNFRKASERMNVTRPALSKQIKDLESELGVQLLERNTVSVRLTPAGDALLQEARSILFQVEKARLQVREIHSGRRGSLRIAGIGPIASGFMPETVKAFAELHPEVRVDFIEMQPPDQLEALADGRIDVGFAYGENTTVPRSLRTLRVLSAKYGVALSHHHRFASHDLLTFADLQHETLLFLGSETNSNHCIDVAALFKAEGRKHGPFRYVQSFDSLLTLIAANQGICLMPRILDLDRIPRMLIKPLHAEHTTLDFSMWAVWRRNESSPLVRDFVSGLKQSVLPHRASA